MKRTFVITGLTAFAIAATSLSAAAAGFGGKRGGHGAMMSSVEFADLDANGDGSVTQEEIAAFRLAKATERFNEVDANGDGTLSAEELTAQAGEQGQERAQRRVAKMIEKRDSNGDGVLSLEEMTAERDRRSPFERADTNADGALSAEEYAAIQDRMEKMKDKKRHGKKDGEHGKRQQQGQDNN